MDFFFGWSPNWPHVWDGRLGFICGTPFFYIKFFITYYSYVNWAYSLLLFGGHYGFLCKAAYWASCVPWPVWLLSGAHPDF